MAATYPASAKTFTPLVDGTDYPQADHLHQAYDEITAMQQAILTDGLEHNLFPQATGDARTLGTSSKYWGLSYLKAVSLLDAAELTIATGAVVVTQGYHKIDTEGDAASDDLDTLTATGLTAGFLVILRAENTARVVTVKDGSGNLLLNGDFALSATDRTITLIYDGTNWREVARSVPPTTLLQVGTTPGTDIAGGATVYLGGRGHSTTEVNAEGVVARAGVLRNLRIKFVGSPGVGQSWTVTLRKNQADTALTVTVSEPSSSGADTTNTVSVAAGDQIAVKVVASAGATSRQTSASVELS